MATKTTKKKAKKRAPDDPYAVPSVSGFQEVGSIIALLSQSDELFRAETDYDSHFQKRVDEVAKLRAELAVEESKLAHEFGPILQLARELTGSRPPAGSGQHYDRGIRSLCATMKPTLSERFGRGKAKEWSVLQERGGTDDDVYKCLRAIPGQLHNQKHLFEFEFDLGGATEELIQRPIGQDEGVAVVKGRSNIIAEVRRVMGIGQPAKAAAALKKKPTTKATKKKPGGKAAAVKTKPTTRPAPLRSATKSSKSAPSSATAAAPNKSAGKKKNGTAKRRKKAISKSVLEQVGMLDVEAESKLLDEAWSLLKEHGPLRPVELSKRTNLTPMEAAGRLVKLRTLGRAAVSAVGVYHVLEPSDAASAAATNGGSGKAAKATAESVLRANGSCGPSTVANELNISRDAAGAALRRLVKKGIARRSGDFFEFVDPVKTGEGKKLYEMNDAELDAKVMSTEPLAEDDGPEKNVDENDDDTSGQYQPTNGSGRATAATLAKRGVAHRNPAATKPLFGGKPK